MRHLKRVIGFPTQKKINQNLLFNITNGVVLTTTIFLSVLFVQSCDIDETRVKEDIENVLLAEGYPYVTFTYDDGIAQLKGNVFSDEERIRVERDIRKVRYVKIVQNKLNVTSKPKELVKLDKSLQSDIAHQLSSERCDGLTVNVNNGIVTLSGKIKNQDLPKVMNIACCSNPKQVRTNIVIIDQ